MNKIFELFLLQCNPLGYSEAKNGLLYSCTQKALITVPLECHIQICINDSIVIFAAYDHENLTEESEAFSLLKITMSDFLTWSMAVEWKSKKDSEALTQKKDRLKFQKEDMILIESNF